MSKAAELANLIGNINAGGGGVNRNVIINGAMNVAQRGSQSMAHDGTTSTHACDRFLAVFVNMDELDGTLSQDSSAPDGFANSLKWATGTAESAIAATEYYTIVQKIEAQNLQALKYGTSGAVPITLTFYVKSSITGTYGITLQQLDVSRNRGSTYTINSANTWEKKTITFSGDTSGVINDDNGEGLRVEWHLAAGSGHAQNGVATTAGATWFLTGVQLEIGQNPTEFEHEPYEATLAKCQRYFQQWTQEASGFATNNYAVVAASVMHGDTYAFMQYHHPVDLRATPSLAFNGSFETNNNGTSRAGSSMAINTKTPHVTSFSAAIPDNNEGGQAGFFRAANDADASIFFDSEL